MAIEMVIALAVFSIVCLPVLIFVLSSEDLESGKDRSEAAAEIARSSGELHAIQAEEMNAYENRHSCDVALVGLASRAEAGPVPVPSVTYPGFFHHDRNVISSIRSVLHGGSSRIAIGANSGSTTDPDLYIYAANSHEQIAEFQTGPGIVDFDVSSGYLYAVERSVVSPLWRARLEDVFSAGSALAIDRIPVPLQQVLPLRVSAAEDYVFMGTDKSSSASGEVLMLQRLSGTDLGAGAADSFVLAAGHEMNAGVNDLARTPRELLVASPSEVELVALSMPDRNHASATPLALAREFDAPGSSGNGKSIAAYRDRVYLGRTIGNAEFYELAPTHSSTGFFPAAIVDTNRTAIQIEEAFGGSYVAILAKVPRPALQIYRRSPSGGYSEYSEAPLPAIPTSMTCEGPSFLVAMESTSTPIASIRF